MTHTSLSRFLIAGSAALAGLLATAPSALAAPLCTFDVGAARLDVALDGGSATLLVTATDVLVNDAPCGPAPDATDAIVVTGGDANDVLTLLGDFRPGLTPEGDGTDEIELTVDLGAGADALVLNLGTTDDVLLFTSTGADLGGDGDQDLSLAGVENVTVRAMSGDDTIDASDYPRAITLLGGTGADTLVGGPGADQIDGGDGNDVLSGGVGDDVLTGGRGNDVEQGQSGRDTFYQQSVANGADRLVGGGGSDTVIYSGRTAALSITLDGTNRADGEAGENDVIGADVENAYGGSGNDFMSGSSAANYLRGGAGNDRLVGKGGNDNLQGGAGADRLDGGTGLDIFAAGGGDDIITGVADGVAELVSCGSGNDSHQAAAEDTFSSCEVATP